MQRACLEVHQAKREVSYDSAMKWIRWGAGREQEGPSVGVVAASAEAVQVSCSSAVEWIRCWSSVLKGAGLLGTGGLGVGTAHAEPRTRGASCFSCSAQQPEGQLLSSSPRKSLAAGGATSPRLTSECAEGGGAVELGCSFCCGLCAPYPSAAPLASACII